MQHGAVAARARDDFHAGALKVQQRGDQIKAGIAVVIRQHARTRSEHGAVQVCEHVANAREALFELACGIRGQNGVGHEEVLPRSLSPQGGGRLTNLSYPHAQRAAKRVGAPAQLKPNTNRAARHPLGMRAALHRGWRMQAGYSTAFTSWSKTRASMDESPS